MKILWKFLSDNRKFITAFLGLYLAYTVGFNQGVSLNNSQQKLAIVQSDKQEASVGGSGENSNPSAFDFSQPAASASPSANSGSVGSETKNSNSPSPSANPSGQNGNAQQSPSPSAGFIQGIVSKTIDATGKYSYMGQDVTYNLTFKNTGGGVSGSVGGICEGKVDGTFDGRDGGDISGTVKGSCGVGFLSKKLDAKYSGKVYLNRGVMNITLSGEIPFVEGDQSFSLSFNP